MLELEKIGFTGNEHFSNNELKSVISLRESPNAVSQFLKNSFIGLGEEAVYFDSLLIEEELYKLKSFYFNHGFFQTAISAEFDIDSTDKALIENEIKKLKDKANISGLRVDSFALFSKSSFSKELLNIKDKDLIPVSDFCFFTWI